MGEKDQVQVGFTVERDQIAKLQKSFPESEDIQEVATTLARLMLYEIIGLLAGEKRYLSLSHQYVEWLQEIYAEILPGEEYTYERLYNEFNFPPGTAQYLARVLRDRQNADLHKRAKARLKKTISKEITEHDNLPADKQPKAKLRSVKISAREYDLLILAVDRLFAKEEDIEYPKVTSRRTGRFVGISMHVEGLKKVLPEIESL